MAAETQAEIQALLRFLTLSAKVPLAVALPKSNLLRKQGLTSVDAIAKSDASTLKPIFEDDKTTKQVHNAAKRICNPKKRAAPQNDTPLPSKQARVNDDGETELAVPQTDASIEELQAVQIECNRAPLLIAFAFSVAKYTLPGQPLSSRYSLAQAVASAGAQSKAKAIGLTDSTAAEEGWAEGQPSVTLMGRKIPVMRRHIVVEDHTEEEDSQKTVTPNTPAANHEAFWGIDLPALKKANGPLVVGKTKNSTGPPVHRPQAARSYLLRAIDLVEEDKSTLKMSLAAKNARKEKAVAMLLYAIDYVCISWANTLSTNELDGRANFWYAKVRPEVEYGPAGWGQRGKVSLKAILDLAKDKES